MFSEAEAFLDAIFEQPDDDTARLVYADWLEDHGQADYAQFIRLQCAAARERPWSPEANRLWEEIGRVWPALAQAHWLSDWPDWRLPNGYHSGNIDAIWFRRGFLAPGVGVGFDLLARFWTLWWPWFPTASCCLAPCLGWERLAAGCPTISRIRRLRLELGWPAAELEEFLSSPNLAGLTSLDLTADVASEELLSFLLRPGPLPRVTELSIGLFDWEERSRDLDQPLPTGIVPVDEIRRRLEARYERVRITFPR